MATGDPTDLGNFDGRPIMSQAVRVTRTGDGLSQALAVAPGEMHIGDTVYFAVRGVVAKITHERVIDKGEDSGFMRRVIVIEADAATPVKESAVRKALADTAKAIEKARGIEQLAGWEEIDE